MHMHICIILKCAVFLIVSGFLYAFLYPDKFAPCFPKQGQHIEILIECVSDGF